MFSVTNVLSRGWIKVWRWWPQRSTSWMPSSGWPTGWLTAITRKPHAPHLKTLVRRSLVASGNKGKCRGEVVVIGAVRGLGRDAKPSVALVQIARTGNVLIILDKGAVVLAPWAAGPLPRLQAIARVHSSNAAVAIARIGIPIGAIDGKSICCIPQQHHSVAAA